MNFSTLSQFRRRLLRQGGATVALVAAFHLSSCGRDADTSNGVKSSTQAQLADLNGIEVPKADNTPSLSSAAEPPAKATPSAAVYWPLWQCNAYPINGMPFMYWIHANAAFAARTAMNACWSTYYVPCNYTCFRVR